MTDNADLSLGRWRITNLSAGVPISRGADVEIRLSATELLLAGSDGAPVGSCPLSAAAVDVIGTFDGRLRLGSQAIWIKSMETSTSGDLRKALLARCSPSTDAASPPGAPAIFASNESLLLGCSIVAVDLVLLAWIGLTAFGEACGPSCFAGGPPPVLPLPAGVLVVLVIVSSILLFVFVDRLGRRNR